MGNLLSDILMFDQRSLIHWWELGPRRSMLDRKGFQFSAEQG
jgi:hypothetical protein